MIVDSYSYRLYDVIYLADPHNQKLWFTWVYADNWRDHEYRVWYKDLEFVDGFQASALCRELGSLNEELINLLKTERDELP